MIMSNVLFTMMLILRRQHLLVSSWAGDRLGYFMSHYLIYQLLCLKKNTFFSKEGALISSTLRKDENLLIPGDCRAYGTTFNSNTMVCAGDGMKDLLHVFKTLEGKNISFKHFRLARPMRLRQWRPTCSKRFDSIMNLDNYKIIKVVVLLFC